MEIYAAYGSNMSIVHMGIRCPSAKLLGTGVIRGYRLTFRGSGRGLANIEKLEGRFVPVVLWEVTKKCEKSLDIYEGYPRLYVKKDIEFVDEKGEIATAFVYVMAKEFANTPAQPTRYYLDLIWYSYMEHEIGVNTLRTAMSENLMEIDERLNRLRNNKSGGN